MKARTAIETADARASLVEGEYECVAIRRVPHFRIRTMKRRSTKRRHVLNLPSEDRLFHADLAEGNLIHLRKNLNRDRFRYFA